MDEIVIRVEAEEAIRLRGILLDGDEAEALRQRRVGYQVRRRS